jgi:hypothetical protein
MLDYKKQGVFMLGLQGWAVPLGFLLTLFSAILCVIYGILNWNKGYLTDEEFEQEKQWVEEQDKVKENL